MRIFLEVLKFSSIILSGICIIGYLNRVNIESGLAAIYFILVALLIERSK